MVLTCGVVWSRCVQAKLVKDRKEEYLRARQKEEEEDLDELDIFKSTYDPYDTTTR